MTTLRDHLQIIEASLHIHIGRRAAAAVPRSRGVVAAGAMTRDAFDLEGP